MVSSKLDLVRGICGRWERGLYGDTSWADSDIEFVIADGSRTRGVERVAGTAEGWGGFLGAWADHRAPAEEYFELDDERVLMLGPRYPGQDERLGARRELDRVASLFRDGKVTRRAAEPAAELTERLSYPAAAVVTLEAQGAATGGVDGAQRLHAAREQWTAIGRVLDAARCQLLIGESLKDEDPLAAGEALELAARSYEELGIEHLVERSRELATA